MKRRKTLVGKSISILPVKNKFKISPAKRHLIIRNIEKRIKEKAPSR